METKIRNEYKIKFLSHGIVAALFILVGLGEVTNTINIVDTIQAKVFFGMAIIAIASAGTAFYSYYLLRKSSKAMEAIVVAESDERTIAVKNEAYAKTFLILKWLLTYTFFTYTFLLPKEVFVSFGWWSLLLIYLSSLLMSAGIYIFVDKKY